MAAAEMDADTVRLRRFDWRTDRTAVLSFQYEIYETNFPGFTVDDDFIRDYGLNLRDAAKNPGEHVVVLERDGRVVGFMWLSLLSNLLDSCIGYIKNIYVAPEFRGQGYGRRLLETADRWFEDHGAARATLDASIGNERAVRLYEHAGYKITRYRMEKRYDDADR